MFDDEIIDANNFDFAGSEYDPIKEMRATEQEILAELGKIDSGNRSEMLPALQKIYDMRELDQYYLYISSYPETNFLRDKTPQIMKYQIFNEETQFYNDDSDKWNRKLKTGLAQDILEMYIEKILATKLRFFADSKYTAEVDSEFINPIVLESIVTGISKYETCLVLAKDINYEYDDIIENGDIIGASLKSQSLERVSVYPPHMYDLKNKKLILRQKSGGIKTVSFAGEKYVELKGDSLLYKKRELVYLASLFVTNFGIEGENGKMKIHVDERYGEGLSKDAYTVYDSIQSGGTKDFDPLWKTTQGQIRPNDWKTSLETVLYLISRSVGIDIRGTVYSTATQADISNLDNVIKINAKLKKLQYAINKVLQEILGITNVYARFDTFSHDNVDQKLSRLETAYSMGGLLVEDYMKEMYSILNLKAPSQEQIVKLKVERNIPLTANEIVLGLDPEGVGSEGE